YVEVLMKCFFNWAEFYVLTEIYGNNMQKLKITYYLETESYGLIYRKDKLIILQKLDFQDIAKRMEDIIAWMDKNGLKISEA
ncbi:MAG: hypothetical protein FWD52_09335, partial [Candidatus Bathyarchaeota archaeon]|nr:hypothetical protein [Candidatus Termiticorpusculum sp.]